MINIICESIALTRLNQTKKVKIIYSNNKLS